LISHALEQQKPIEFDLSRTDHVDGRYFGLLLALWCQLAKRGQSPVISGATRLTRIFRLNRFEFLLGDG
jgi:hypothetical protein